MGDPRAWGKPAVNVRDRMAILGILLVGAFMILLPMPGHAQKGMRGCLIVS